VRTSKGWSAPKGAQQSKGGRPTKAKTKRARKTKKAKSDDVKNACPAAASFSHKPSTRKLINEALNPSTN
jgi:hypothetical protein